MLGAHCSTVPGVFFEPVGLVEIVRTLRCGLGELGAFSPGLPVFYVSQTVRMITHRRHHSAL